MLWRRGHWLLGLRRWWGEGCNIPLPQAGGARGGGERSELLGSPLNNQLALRRPTPGPSRLREGR